ncbi:MAG: hypothetical protein AAF658_20805, partial [Myxococcota bacterium]
MNTRLAQSAALIASVCLTACGSESDESQTNLNTETPSDSIALSAGSVGLVIDTREIAKRGYEPSRVAVSFDGDLAEFSATLSVDAPTSVATLSIEVANLTEAQLERFASGVGVSLSIEDSGGNVLESLVDTVSIDSTNSPLSVQTSLEPIFPEPAIRENVPYLIQVVSPNSDSNGLLMRLHIDDIFEPGLDPFVLDVVQPTVDPQFYEIYFESAGNGDYFMKYIDPRDDTEYYLEMSIPGFLYNFYRTAPPVDMNGVYRVERTASGNLSIQPRNGDILTDFDVSNDMNQPFTLLTNGDANNTVELRIVAANIEWSVEDRGTEFSAPILPPAQLDFAYRSVLRNCSGATVTETVGQSESRPRETSMGTEESLELYSGSTSEVGVTAGVEVSASFFG